MFKLFSECWRMIERWEKWNRMKNLKCSAQTSLSILSKKHDDHEWSFCWRNLWQTVVSRMMMKRRILMMSLSQDLQRHRKNNNWELVRCQINKAELFLIFKWLNSFIENQCKIACEDQKRHEERLMTTRITMMKTMMKKKMKKTEKFWTRMMQLTSWMRTLTKLFILWAKFIWIKICSSYRLCQQLKEKFDLCLKKLIMNSWKLIVQHVLAHHHLHCKAHVFSKINKSFDFKSSSSDCIKEAWSSFYLIIFIFWMISLIWFFQSWWLQTLQRIVLLSELNFTFNWLHSMILCSQSF